MHEKRVRTDARANPVGCQVEVRETAASVAAQAAALYGHGGAAAPVLALGVFERVGSNWLSDSLRPTMPQHNEPFRQQLGADHPLSPLNPTAPELNRVLAPVQRHHLASALRDLYGQPRHLVKETNLFFAADTVLGLLPDSPALVLTRAPVGVASSFARGRLWARWHYAERYAQLAQVARAGRWQDFAPLLPLDDPAEPAGLGRLIATNALLLARALSEGDRAWAAVPYEQHVSDRADAWDRLARDLGIHLPPGQPVSPGTSAAADVTFATTGHKDQLLAELDRDVADQVSHHAIATVERAGAFLDTSVCTTARGWLAGDHLYEVSGTVAPGRPRARRATNPAPRIPTAAFRPVTRVSWRNTLTTNAEMADLLTELHAAGAANTQDGTNLLVCPMPHERGGRLHFDAEHRRWQVSPGYESHPAYWVTWIGAAVRAAWTGARLPTRGEALAATVGIPQPYNCDYAVGDTSPVAEPGRGPGQVHHLVGNLQIWCSDGPAGTEDGPLQRYLFGAAWNTPGDAKAVAEMRSRFLLGSSRGVGVRLVRDPDINESSGLGVWELAELINRWTEALGDQTRSVGELDRRLVADLTGQDPAAS